METDDIRASLFEARRASAELERIGDDGKIDSARLARVQEALTRLTANAELLLNERLELAGRLRRKPMVIPPVEVPEMEMPDSSSTDLAIRPSPASDA